MAAITFRVSLTLMDQAADARPAPSMAIETLTRSPTTVEARHAVILSTLLAANRMFSYEVHRSLENLSKSFQTMESLFFSPTRTSRFHRLEELSRPRGARLPLIMAISSMLFFVASASQTEPLNFAYRLSTFERNWELIDNVDVHERFRLAADGYWFDPNKQPLPAICCVSCGQSPHQGGHALDCRFKELLASLDPNSQLRLLGQRDSSAIEIIANWRPLSKWLRDDNCLTLHLVESFGFSRSQVMMAACRLFWRAGCDSAMLSNSLKAGDLVEEMQKYPSAAEAIDVEPLLAFFAEDHA